MDLAARHVGFVLAAYGVAFVALAALIAGIVIRARNVRRRLEELERIGAPRRRRMAAGADAPDGAEKSADVSGEKELPA